MSSGSINDLRKRITLIDHQRVQAEGDLTAARQDRAKAVQQQTVLEKVSALYKQVMDQGLSQSFKMVEDLVSEGIATVYGTRQLQLRLTPVEKRGVYSVEISTQDILRDIDGPAHDMFGGAVVQIESFLLRIVFLMQTQMLPVMVMDESFNCVSDGYLQNLAVMLRETCRKFGLDILLVTHKNEMKSSADTVLLGEDKGDGKGLQLRKVR